VFGLSKNNSFLLITFLRSEKFVGLDSVNITQNRYEKHKFLVVGQFEIRLKFCKSSFNERCGIKRAANHKRAFLG
jgi:hypothetical protein